MSSLVDQYGRTIDYLRLSVTENCNYHCSYCRPGMDGVGVRREERLTDDEMIRLIDCFVCLGVRHLRLTGGEPLLHRGVAALIRAAKACRGLQTVSLSSNGDRLIYRVDELKAAGLDRINISLDTLQRDRFRRITGKDGLNRVLAGIDAAVEAGLAPVKVNMVVMRGINDDEIVPMFEYCRERGVHLRFIESMPLGQSTVDASHFMAAAEVADILQGHYGDRLLPIAGPMSAGPARYYTLDGEGSVGFISAMSQHFCESCNRVRLTSTGEMALCLGERESIPLGTLLREGANFETLGDAIRQGINMKPLQHIMSHEKPLTFREMSVIGG